MNNVYIITRIMEDETSIPNLGVHFNKKKALDHFEDVIKDRKNRMALIHYVRTYEINHKLREILLKEALILNLNGPKEILRLEHWKV